MKSTPTKNHPDLNLPAKMIALPVQQNQDNMSFFNGLLNRFESKSLHYFYLLCLISSIVLLLINVFVALAYYPNAALNETAIGYYIARLLKGMPLYMQPDQAPFNVVQYTPLYYYLCAGIGKIMRISPDNIHGIHILIRGVSLAINIISFRILYITLVQNFRVNHKWAFIFSFYSMITGYFLAVLQGRCDTLEFLFSALAIYFITKTFSVQHLHLYILAALSAVLAVFSKQSGIVAVGLVFAVMLCQKQWKSLLISLLATVVSTGLLMWLSAESIQVFLANVVGGVRNPLDFKWFYKAILLNILQPAFIIAFGIMLTVKWLSQKTDIFKAFLLFAFAAYLGFACLTVLKIGSHLGYFVPALTMVFMMMAVDFSETDTSQQASQNRTNVYLMLISSIFFGFVFMGSLVNYGSNWGTWKAEYANQQAIRKYFTDSLKIADNEYILVSRGGYDTYLKEILYDKTFICQNEIIFNCLLPTGVFNYEKLFETTRNGTLKYIVTAAGEKPDAVHQFGGKQENFGAFAFEKYHFLKSMYGFDIYVWKP